MDMDTEELARAMHAATDDLATRPGFESMVVAGAVRRRRRRQTTVVGIAMAVAAVVGAGAYGVFAEPDGSNGVQVARPLDNAWLLDEPTHGDLAEDEAFLKRAEQAWSRGIKTSPNGTGKRVTGDPHVYWAGNTDAGQVAFVAQRAEGSVDSEDSVALGLIAGRTPKLVNESSNAGSSAFLFGPGDRYAIALREYGRLLISPRWQISPDGTGERKWRPMRALDDTMQFAELPAGTKPTEVEVGKRGVEKAKTSEQAHKLSPTVLASSRYRLGWSRQGKIVIDNRLPWDPNLTIRIGDAKDPALDDRDHLFQAAEAAGMQDPLNDVWLSGFSVVAELPGVGSVEAFELQPAVDSPTGFYALVKDSPDAEPRLVYGGVINAGETLPARVELPAEQGWIVAHHKASLRYRTTAGDEWVDAGQDAALLPHDAEAVEVTLPGQAPEVVVLTE